MTACNENEKNQTIKNDPKLSAPSKHKITLLGGDLRQIYLALSLSEMKYQVTVYANDITNYSMSTSEINYFNQQIEIAQSLPLALQDGDVVIGPVPFSKDGATIYSKVTLPDLSISNFLQNLTHRPIVIAGNLSSHIANFLTEHSIAYCDFMKSESLAISNAIATAEGTIAEAIKKSVINLHQSKCLVLGFGRCAKILSDKLRGMNCNVTIAARRSEVLAFAKAYGFRTILTNQLCDELGNYDFIFNTVPTKLLTGELLQNVKDNVIIIDIASSPGGVDYEVAKNRSINASLCLALPGIYAPKSSAEIILSEILEFLAGLN